MSSASRVVAAVLLVALLTVEVGGGSLLAMLTRRMPGYLDNPLRQNLFRAMHAHAGVWVVLALVGHRDLDQQLLGRWRDRPAAGWHAAGALLVGLGVPAGGASDGAAAGAGAARAAGVPGPRSGPPRPGQRGSAPGRGAAAIFGLKEAAQNGFGWPPATSILLGLVVGAVFVRRQLHLADPLIDLRLFRIPAFNVSLATNLLGIFIAVGYFLFVAQYLQLVLGLSPLQAALWSLPSAAGLTVGSNLAPRILRRTRPAFVVGAGLAWLPSAWGC